ncbi:MAG: hypothetical protein PHP85_12515 [Gallionella sp.]|nr:hypothetical protein [Gallionella sp.]
MNFTKFFHFRAGLIGAVGIAMSVYSAWLLWRDAEELVVRVVLCALIVGGLVMMFDAWFGWKKRRVAVDVPIAPVEAVPETRSRQSEVVSEFEVEGMHFLVLWKPGLCLLRTIESYGTADARQYTASDLFTQLYDGSPDYELGRDEAIAQAPLVATMLVHEQRAREVAFLAQLYASPEMQRDYPVYQIWQQEAGGVSRPVIWASHNAGLYWRVDGQWQVAGGAQSRIEAEACIGAINLKKADSRGDAENAE